jgi:hypothetical protein
MKSSSVILGALVGLFLGVVGTAFCIPPAIRQRLYTDYTNTANAGNSDRYDDYVMCTGAAAPNPRAPTEGVWLLDYRAGKLLGTVIDRNQQKIVGFAETNLVQDFGIPPRQNVHFLMTTGMIAQGQSALYVAETTSGKFGVYSLGPDPTGQQPGLFIRKHDLTTFRKTPGK